MERQAVVQYLALFVLTVSTLGGVLVVIEGRAPIWRYGMAFHLLHGSAAMAVAVFDPRLGAVVVASHHPNWHEGQVIDCCSPGRI